MRPVLLALSIASALLLVSAAPAHPSTTRMGDPSIAALQVGLRASGLYHGTIDGQLAAQTEAAIRALQQRANLPVDGRAGPTLRRALGRFGNASPLPLRRGAIGFDVAALQFQLAWHGFPGGTLSGSFDSHTEAAVSRFQRFAALPATGVVDAATLAALAGPVAAAPFTLANPLPEATLGDGFGPRADRFHAGLDLAAPRGTAIVAAAGGRVVRAGALGGGFGLGVVVDNGQSVETLYAHLAQVEVRRGETINVGSELGRVGATGDASGPHLHFELHLRGAALDPATAFAPAA